jgi:hypothetical protein
VTLWVNIAGNQWSEPIRIDGTPLVTDADSIRFADMLGNGVAGVLWSRDFSSGTRDRLFFLDFTGGSKPYLLHEIDNQIGAITRIIYAPSTRFFLEDQERSETHWRTTLPFPVHVVAHIEVIDAISRGKLTTEYRYHHGLWDGVEREFRGFAIVEQIDSEFFDRHNDQDSVGDDTLQAIVERKYFSAPTPTKTWFHLGPVGDEFGGWEELDLLNEYWTGDRPLLGHIPQSINFLGPLSANSNGRRVRRDGPRALRGRIHRSQLYALDGSLRDDRPYTVTEYAYGLREESPPKDTSTDCASFFRTRSCSVRRNGSVATIP